MRLAQHCLLSFAVLLFACMFLPSGAAAQMFQCPPGTTDAGVSGPPGAYGCRCPDGSLASIYGCPSTSGAPPQQPTMQPPQSICPSPARWVSIGNAFMCQCPNGQMLSLGQTCQAYTPPPVGDHCSNGGTCPVGYVCSRMPGRCVPLGKIDCGNHYCEPGEQCSRNGGCIPAGSVDCGSYSCAAGSTCGSGNQCLAAGMTDCGNGISCSPGQKCSWSGKSCISQDAIDCSNHVCGAGFQCGANNQCIPKNTVDCGHGHYCEAGQACGSNYQCMARNAVDCGDGQSCPAGKQCVNGGLECLTRKQIADRREAERKEKLATAHAALDYKERKAHSQHVASKLCGDKQSCISTVIQASTLSPGTESTQLATIDAKWAPIKTQVVTILPPPKQKQPSGVVLHATGTPIQTIPFGKGVAVGSPVTIGTPVSIVGILQNLGNSKVVQVGLDSAAAAGQDAASLMLSGGALKSVNAIGNLSTVAQIAAAYKTGGWLAASQSVAEQATIMAGGSLGAALVPASPLVGKAIGTAVSEGAVYAGTTYVSPAIGNILFNADPNFWTPH
jgi:hypothetical protein